MFGINDQIGNAGLAQVKARLLGVKYVLFDKVSILSAQDMYHISNQLNKVLNINELPFGGLKFFVEILHSYLQLLEVKKLHY